MWEMFSFKNYAENEAGILVPNLFSLKKGFIWNKNKWSVP